MMKAVFFKHYGSANVVAVKEVEKPTPGANEVFVKVFASSVTMADTMMREGKPCYGRLFLGLRKHKNPLAGTGFSGEIETVGHQVKRFKSGDAVFGETGMAFGANAEYLCIPEDGVIVNKPNEISDEQAATMCDGAVTSLAFIRDLGQLKKGQDVLIIGASGSLGTAAIQIAKVIGANVTGVCSSNNKKLIKMLGADHFIDYTQQDFTKNEQQYDVIYDAIGVSSFKDCKQSLKSKGIYLSPVLSLSLVFHWLKTSIAHGKKAKFDAIGMRPEIELNEYLEELKAWYKKGDIYSVIDRTFLLSDAMTAHKYVDTGRKKGNVVLTQG